MRERATETDQISVQRLLSPEARRILRATGRVEQRRDLRSGEMTPTPQSRRRYLDHLAGFGLADRLRRLERAERELGRR